MKASTVVNVAILVIGLCNTAWAAPTANRSLLEVLQQSDLVFAGTITDATSVGPSSGTLTLLPAEIFKGNAPFGPVTISYSGITTIPREYLVNKAATIFATASGRPSEYRLIPLQVGSLFLDSQIFLRDLRNGTDVQTTESGTDVQRLIQHIAGIYAASPSFDLVLYLLDPNLFRMEPDMLKSSFRTILSSAKPDAFQHGMMGLVRFGDLESLQLLDAVPASARSATPIILRDFENLYKSASPLGVEILERWLDPDRPPAERQAAAGALAHIRTPSAILILGRLLYDPDYEVRWRVIGGLSSFANNIMPGTPAQAPGPAPFLSDETIRYSIFDRRLKDRGEEPYLNFWRTWWNRNQPEIEKMASASVN